MSSGKFQRAILPVCFMAAVFTASVSAQTFVYPAKGQSPDQQKKDEGECYTWAVQQSKYDPANPPPAAAAAPPPNTTATGTTKGAGARGAARGAVVGEIVADDASTGAAVGAAAARGQSRRQNHRRRSNSNRRARSKPSRDVRVQQGARGVPRRARLFGEVGKPCKYGEGVMRK